jgi:hypothetical protein
MGLTSTSSLSYWLRFQFTNYPDTVYCRISTNGNRPENFNIIACTTAWTKRSYTNNFAPWTNIVINLGGLGIPAGTPIHMAIQEYEWDNTWNEAALELDVIRSDLTPRPSTNSVLVTPSLLTFENEWLSPTNPAPAYMTVRNIGSGDFAVSNKITYSSNGSGWLTLPMGSPHVDVGQSCTFTASVNSASLPRGTYYATNSIYVLGASDNPIRQQFVLNVTRWHQAITFPAIPAQSVSNRVTLSATATSDLLVTYGVEFGPGKITGGTTLSFTGSGTVGIVAMQPGDGTWLPAPVRTNLIAVLQAIQINLQDLEQTYSGSPRPVTATTVPPGQVVSLRYNGSTVAPIDAGTCTVVGSVSNGTYLGSSTGTLTIAKASQAAITFTPPAFQDYNTTNPLVATGGSGPGAWSFSIVDGASIAELIDGSNLWMKLGSGVVTVRATHDASSNYLVATRDATITARKSAQTIDFPAIPPQLTTNRVALSASARSGLPVTFAVGSGAAVLSNGTNLSFTGAGPVAIVASQAGDDLWQAAEATNTFSVGKTPASIALTNLVQSYTTAPCTVAAVTEPVGLAATFAYSGSSNAPSVVGSYEVVGTIQDELFQGSGTGILVIVQADQLISFPAIPNQVTTNAPGLAATAGSGLEVSYAVISGPATLSGTNLVFTAAGTVAVAASQAGDTNWHAAAPVTNSFMVAKTVASLVLAPLSQEYDGTARPVQAFTTPGNLAVTVTYNGTPSAPTGIGTYSVTGTVNDIMWQGTQAGILAITKATQVITNYLPEPGRHFFLGDTALISAQASSGLPVTFSNLTPSVCTLAGSTLTFTHQGTASVRARQAGDSNWNATATTQSWLAGGSLTNLSRTSANVGGGVEVTLLGCWLGNGSDITNVSLAGTPAVILTQTVSSVTVRAGQSTGPCTGDVAAVSGVGGLMLMPNAFSYLPFAAPVMQPPLAITPSNLLARWTVPAAAQHLEFDAGQNTNFSPCLAGYRKLNLALAGQYPVTGLTNGQWVALRIFAWDTNGYSLPSDTIWVPAGTNTAYEIASPAAWLVPLGGRLDVPLTNLFAGSGLTFSSESSNTQRVTVSVSGSLLRMVGRAPGTALITVRASNPMTGYACRAILQAEVGSLPVALSSIFLPHPPLDTRYEQVVTVQNTSGLDVSGFQLLFTNLMPGITVLNTTGLAWDGRPMIQKAVSFPDGSTQSVTVVYNCKGAYTVDRYPPLIEALYLGARQPLPQLSQAPHISGALMQDQSGRFLLETESVIGGLYVVEYMNNFPTGGWIQLPNQLKAGTNRTQWIDPGPPTTLPASGVRVYRILQLSE